jgi:hypothetical protein
VDQRRCAGCSSSGYWWKALPRRGRRLVSRPLGPRSLRSTPRIKARGRRIPQRVAPAPGETGSTTRSRATRPLVARGVRPIARRAARDWSDARVVLKLCRSNSPSSLDRDTAVVFAKTGRPAGARLGRVDHDAEQTGLKSCIRLVERNTTGPNLDTPATADSIASPPPHFAIRAAKTARGRCRKVS